ncbi:MAG: hypothetical protein HYX51_03630 [Chloroflexi bacterium]|nr:hypothetical protein [Chloroflexota bacterium]
MLKCAAAMAGRAAGIVAHHDRVHSCARVPCPVASTRAARESLTEFGTIILLNGTVSAGKTSLARAVQHVIEKPYLHLGAGFSVNRSPFPRPTVHIPPH